MVFRRKGDGCLLILKAFSCETDLWVTIGDFALKKNRTIGKGDLYLTKNRSDRNEICCAEDNYSFI